MKRSPPVRPCARRRFARKGSLTLQAIFVLPILLIVFFGTIQVGFLITLKQAVSHAATIGAREAGKGATLAQVVCVVDSILKSHGLAVGTDVAVTLENPTVSSQGTPACDPPTAPTLASDEVRVTVCVDLSNLTVGNTLKSIGISAIGKTFRVSSVVKKEA
jgi:Flp pilus assembly protein TadG